MGSRQSQKLVDINHLFKVTQVNEVTSIKWHQRDSKTYESYMNYLEIQMRCFDVFIYSFVYISDKQNVNS